MRVFDCEIFRFAISEYPSEAASRRLSVQVPQKLTLLEQAPAKTHEAIVALFREKPVWACAAVDDLITTKRLPTGTRRWLLSYGYRFLDGPWVNAWVERGLDPRELPALRVHQTLNFRTGPSWCETP